MGRCRGYRLQNFIFNPIIRLKFPKNDKVAHSDLESRHLPKSSQQITMKQKT